MSKTIFIALTLIVAGVLWAGDKLGGLSADLKGFLPSVAETADELSEFVQAAEHPLILAAIVVVGVLVAYRLAKTILLIGTVALLVFVLVKVVPTI
jgi:hypothetical protein